MHNQDKALRSPCVRRTLNEYLWRTGNFRQQGTLSPMADSARLNPSPSKGFPIGWWSALNTFTPKLYSPVGVEGHYTCIAVTYADMAGADPQSICKATAWSNSNLFAKFYRLDSIANSVMEFGRRVHLPAPLPRPHTIGVGIVYPGSTTSVGRGEPHTNHNISTLAVTLAATTTLAHTSQLVIRIMKRNTSLARLFGCSLWPLTLLNWTLVVYLRTGIHPPIGMAP